MFLMYYKHTPCYDIVSYHIHSNGGPMLHSNGGPMLHINGGPMLHIIGGSMD